MPDITHISVGEGLVPSRVKDPNIRVITPGGHRTLPYDTVVSGAIDSPSMIGER